MKEGLGLDTESDTAVSPKHKILFEIEPAVVFIEDVTGLPAIISTGNGKPLPLSTPEHPCSSVTNI